MNSIDVKDEMNQCIKRRDMDGCVEIYERLSDRDKAEKSMTAFGVLLKIAKMEKDHGYKGLFYQSDCNDFDSLVALYDEVKHTLRRMEFRIDDKLSSGFVNLGISKYMMLMMVSLFSYDRKKVADLLEKCYQENGNVEMAQALHSLVN